MKRHAKTFQLTSKLIYILASAYNFDGSGEHTKIYNVIQYKCDTEKTEVQQYLTYRKFYWKEKAQCKTNDGLKSNNYIVHKGTKS